MTNSKALLERMTPRNYVLQTNTGYRFPPDPWVNEDQIDPDRFAEKEEAFPIP